MNLTRSKHAAVAAVLVAALGACAEPEPTEDGSEMTATAALGGRSDLDNDLGAFLPGYAAEDERFSDDQLDFDVDNGVVTIRGVVDDEAEREALIRRIGRVPGVREVSAAGLSLAGL